MSQTSYADPILLLARDPDLVRDSAKELQLAHLIRELAERNLSRLCLACAALIRSLEKISLRLKGWEFVSLDINSDNHFENRDLKMRDFNNGLADKVMGTCQDCNRKICAVALEIDRISKASRNLSPAEYISDGGTLLLSLLLRGMNLKAELSELVTVAYLKAKIILIGRDLESMLITGEDQTTILTYKSFISNLLKQLDSSIEREDSEAKMECLAVISDMEKMFESFKAEKARESARRKQVEYDDERSRYEEEKAAWLGTRQQERKAQEEKTAQEMNQFGNRPRSRYKAETRHEYHRAAYNSQPRKDHRASTSTHSLDAEDSDTLNKFYDENLLSGSDENSMSMSMSMASKDHAPLIHSITKLDTGRSHRRDSISSMASSTLLHKTTITDEMPYLMTAFSSVKNIQRDISHFKLEEDEEQESAASIAASPLQSPNQLSSSASLNGELVNFVQPKSFKMNYTGGLASHPLQKDNAFINPRIGSINPQQVYANNSLLLKMGIRPQVIQTAIPTCDLDNKRFYQPKRPRTAPAIMASAPMDDENKENADTSTPLTRENLESHTHLRSVLNEIGEGVD